MKRRTLVGKSVCVSILMFAASVEGGVIVFDFPLNGVQEVPPNDAPATGTAEVMFDPESNLLSWNIEFDVEALESPQTLAHFHAPAPPGMNAPPVITLPLGSPIIGSATITDAQETQLLDQLWYVNIHTQNRPAGEIRGQVVPEPATIGLCAIAGLLLTRRVRHKS